MYTINKFSKYCHKIFYPINGNLGIENLCFTRYPGLGLKIPPIPGNGESGNGFTRLCFGKTGLLKC